mmetsp:Transcript_4870/g.14618  ORF Transcript_4870/g.14618 Transcript_4870/m.14618 type:complete len:263 (-) Transcript_4870:476-1264(-)
MRKPRCHRIVIDLCTGLLPRVRVNDRGRARLRQHVAGLVDAALDLGALLVERVDLVDPQPGPLLHVGLEVLGGLVQRREELHLGGLKRHDHKFHETDLREGSVDLRAVVQHLHGYAQAPFLVTLVEELLETPHRPWVADRPRLARVRHVGRVQKQIHDLLLGVPVGEELRKVIAAIVRMHLIQHVDLLDAREVMHHVGVQNGLDTDAPRLEEVAPPEKLENVCVLLGSHDFKRGGAMHVLERALVIVRQGNVVPDFDQVRIV